MAGLDAAVKIGYALQASGIALYLYEEAYGHFVELPRAAKEASNIEQLAKVELNKTDLTASSPEAEGLANQFDKLTLNPGELGEVIKQMSADKSVDPSLPTLAFTGVGDKPISKWQALILAQNDTNARGGSEKQLLVPLTNFSHNYFKQNPQWMADHNFEVVSPASVTK